MKKINLNKLPTELQRDIIKVIPRAKSINYKGGNMSSKPPKWFEEWYEGFYKEFSEFKQEMYDFRKETNQKFDLLFSLPTIKKELKELDS